MAKAIVQHGEGAEGLGELKEGGFVIRQPGPRFENSELSKTWGH